MKDDEKITRLFKQGLGARKIAKKLGYANYATITKRLKKLGLIRARNSHLLNKDKLKIKFKKNKKNLGRSAEFELIRICNLCGFEYAIPSNYAPYDLLINFGDGLKKVQVKSSYHESESKTGYTFRLKRTRNNATRTVQNKYTKDEVDYFFLHDIEGNNWLIPFDILNNQGTITPALRFPGFKIDI